MKIVFASGKGGTGKTTIAVNLAYYLAESGKKVQYLDCDVEEPNGHLFLKPDYDNKTAVKVMVPSVDLDKCNFCGRCSAECRFNAIVTIKDKVLVFQELCHGCALCVRICPEKAISEEQREIGFIEEGSTVNGISFVQGVLNVGEPMAVPVITAVKKNFKEDYIRIIDAPPGTSCPVVKTITDADFVVFVTEPTPFGLHDLKIAMSVAINMSKLFGVVINRDGEYPPLKEYLDQEDIPVLMSVPEDRDIAEAYSRGELLLISLPGYRDHFKILADNIMKLTGKSL
ncbi:MAG: ATP-binding protein [Spirochaetes bacterium]|nr:ATP-binding protein [Spirochaetota bacterium]